MRTSVFLPSTMFSLGRYHPSHIYTCKRYRGCSPMCIQYVAVHRASVCVCNGSAVCHIVSQTWQPCRATRHSSSALSFPFLYNAAPRASINPETVWTAKHGNLGYSQTQTERACHADSRLCLCATPLLPSFRHHHSEQSRSGVRSICRAGQPAASLLR